MHLFLLRIKFGRELPEFKADNKVTEEYGKAFVEVLEVLNFIEEESYEKIPKEELSFFEENILEEYNYKLNYELSFQEQELSEITRAILSIILRDYLSSKYQRHVLIEKEKAELEEYLEEKKRIFKVEEMIKDRSAETEEIQTNSIEEEFNYKLLNEETALVEYKKKNIFAVFIDNIKKFFTNKFRKENNEEY